MTFPVTPNPAIHTQPKGIRTQQMLYTGGQLEAWAQQLPLAMTLQLMDVILRALGVSPDEITALNNDATAFYNAVQTWLSATNTAAQTAWNNWVTALENLGNTTVTDFTDLINAIDSNASTAAANWTTVLEDLGLSDQTATAFVSFIQTLLTPNSALNASNLWGLLPTPVAGSIAATAVNSSTPNPLWNPNFQAAISVSPGSGWVWDSTVYYSSSVNMPGSAKVTADGTVHGLRSNLIPVSGGQSISLTAQILTSGLVVTGSPIELDVITYLGATQVSQVSIATSGVPAGATTSWVNPPGGSHAGTLTGTYNVPNDGSVDHVLVRLAVNAGATAGDVRFGAVPVTISGGLIATLQSDLSTLQADSTASTAAFATFIQSVETAIAGYTNWTTFIAAVESAWITYSTTESGLVSSAVFTLQNFLNTLLGINTSTGQMSGSNVSNTLGTASLGADVQAIVDDVTNLLSGKTGSGNPLAQLLADGQAALSALLPGVFNNTDGTAVSAANSGVTVNSDGTASYTAAVNAVYALFDNLDGTTMSHGAAVQNIGTGVGTNSYSVQTAATAATDLSNTWMQLFGSDALNHITTIEQDIVNYVSNAISGGSAPTSANSAAVAIYDALLGIPHTNVMIPPSPGSGSITWDANASGAPYAGNTNNLVTVAYNHTCGATANYLIVRLGFYSTYTPVVSVGYNGQFMQLLASQTGADGDTYNQIYGLPNPSTGTHQVSVTLYSPLGNAIQVVAVESDSYVGVGSVGSTASISGSGSSPSLTVPSASGNYIVQAFTNSDTVAGSGLSSYNQTSQYNSGGLHASTVNAALLAGDAAGAPSVSFTATATQPSTAFWTATAVNLIPLPSTVIGSGFRAANTSTSSTSATSGNNPFTNTFNTTITSSADVTYGANNTLTVTHAGWYSVTISILLVSTFANQWIGLNLIQNGTSIKRGHTSWIGGFSSTTVCAHTFQTYCSAGDTLQPGYYSSASGSAFTGTADGLSTYFEVSLNNRGLHS